MHASVKIHSKECRPPSCRLTGTPALNKCGSIIVVGVVTDATSILAKLLPNMSQENNKVGKQESSKPAS